MVRFNRLPDAPGRRRILFFGESVSLAHVARPAVLARWAREAGHEVHFACGSRYAGVARSEGLEPIEIETIDAGDFYARLSKGKFFYTTEELQRYVRAELELIGRLKPDLVVGDFRLTLPISAELAGVKCLSLANAHWSPAAERNLPAPEGGLFGLLPRFLREKLFGLVRPLAYRLFAAPLDRVRRSFGLPAFRDFRGHYTAGDFCAYLDLPALFHRRDAESAENGRRERPSGGVREERYFAGDGFTPRTQPSLCVSSASSAPLRLSNLPANHFFLGPVDWAPSNAPEPLLGELGIVRPLVYVTMGSTGDARRLPKILRALLAAGCDLAVSGVKAAAAAELRLAIPELADRSYIAEFFDARTVLEAAALTVCHGGSGTVYQSLAAGVPVLCCPSNPDQMLVSDAVAAAGAGLVADTGRLAEQIGALLSGGCRAEAQRLASAIAAHDTRSRWLSFLGEGQAMPRRHTLTRHLRALEERIASGPTGEDRFSFGDGRYTIRVANDLESRRKAYQLVYKLYLEKEYAMPHSSRMWLSIFDALPETVTLLVEKQATDHRPQATGTTAEACSHSSLSSGLQPVACSLKPVPVGALTVVFDSAMGLPADKLYKPELDALRSSGRRVAEVTSLAVAEEAGAGAQVLVKLFNFAYFVARGIRGATDFVNTVNPRHVRFYERLMLFAPAGPEREYDKVGGAPAVLMRLDFDVAEVQRVPSSEFRVPGWAGNASLEARDSEPGTRNRRTIYGQFRSVAEEPETVAALRPLLRPMSHEELGYFLVAETDLLAGAAPEQRAYIEKRRPALSPRPFLV